MVPEDEAEAVPDELCVMETVTDDNPDAGADDDGSGVGVAVGTCNDSIPPTLATNTFVPVAGGITKLIKV